MVLFAQHVRANMFTGDVAAGPVPTFFLANTEGEVKELLDHPQEVFKEIQGVMASLVKPEIFGLPAAIQLLKKPREGAGQASYLRRGPSDFEGHQAKKRKLNQATSNDSGARIFCNVPIKSAPTPKYCNIPKNSVISMMAKTPFPPIPALSNNLNGLIQASLANSTWKKYESGWRSFNDFESTYNFQATWPLQANTIRDYVTWGLTVKNLQPATLEAYLSALSMAHKLKGMEVSGGLKDGLTDMLLRGAENLQASKNLSAPRANRRVVTLHTLKIIGSKLATSCRPEVEKQCIWATCCTAFFGSARLGELLTQQETGYDPTANLLWSDVKIKKDSVLIHIKLPKIRSTEGEFIDIFPFEGENCCPLAALKMHKNLQVKFGLFSPSGPVFRFSEEKNLSVASFNRILRALLKDVIPYGTDSITAHSFRAGVASALARFPEIASREDVQGWGRWKSDAFKVYTRFDDDKKRATFATISKILRL